ncbi:AfsR/SARP family transcriptional regulator [Labedaea rhizosphaerae]|uniref:DNA-binding SARP family transcriptional activator n=1 Tax=Labedaea rhizosphaerae TaxID=598644 RepID=A0A4R6SM58_LABRH|nr:BTAD domain-containing putative transcriptional regulator [Labedaea rhizosphaerae]TDQ04640.1 DNA-binding SARP family transcriptional activator [Labedaea rhizosphaerae]
MGGRAAAAGGVRFRLLGPIAALVGEDPLPLGGPGTRAVLALLLLNANQVVPLDRMVDVLWAHEPPATARTIVQGYISRLRKLLAETDPSGSVAIETRPPGYLLVVDESRIDVTWAQRLLARSRGEPARRRAELLREAQRIWRGPALADIKDRVPAPELAELRLAVLEARVDADLELGAHDELVGELAALVDEHPFREHLVRQLILALYRSGRRAAALETYQRFARRAGTERGMDPGPQLRMLHERVLHDDTSLLDIEQPTPRPPMVGVLVPAQLPNTTAGFAGRAAELAWLDEHLSTVDMAATPIAGLIGPAGVGKTALAVRWAHRVARRFPDGQLYASLRGFDVHRAKADPAQLLLRFLLALGVPVGEVPVELDERAALYRSLLADRRMLVVLDDARDSEQVRPLLPGSASALVLVTSRIRLDALVVGSGARMLTLGTLPREDALEVLASTAGPGSDDERADRIRLAQLCGGLPLALRIAGARLAADPQWTAARLADELSGQGQLDVLAAEDNQVSVRAALDATYRALPGRLAATFRLLGLFPGPMLDAYAAAALCGVPVEEAAERLRTMADWSLLVPDGTDGEYHLHDLVRMHAATLARADLYEHQRSEALRRLETYYLAAADQARRFLRPPADGLDYASDYPKESLAPVTDSESALDWFGSQWANLMSTLDAAAAAEHHVQVWHLARLVHDFRAVRSIRDDWLALLDKGLAAARAANDGVGEVWMLSCRCSARYRLGRLDEMLPDAERSVAIATRLRDPALMAIAFRDVGTALYHQGQHEPAVARLEKALELARRAEFKPVEAALLNNLAQVYRDLARLDDAVAATERAVELYREIGELGFSVFAVANLGELHLERGELDDSERYARAAVDQAVTSALTLQEGFARHVLGKVLLAKGDKAAARSQLVAAARRYADVSQRAAAEVQADLDRLQPDV